MGRESENMYSKVWGSKEPFDWKKAPKKEVLKAVREDGWNLYFAVEKAPEKWQDDQEVVLAAVEQDGRTLQFASLRLRSVPEVVLAATAVHKSATYYARASTRMR